MKLKRIFLALLLYFNLDPAAFSQTIDAVSRTLYGATTSITYASHIAGVKLDCVVSTGLTATGGACTDNTSALNAVLATATAAHPVNLILDGGTSITGLYGPAGGYWSLDCVNWNNGVFIASGSNAHVIRNISSINGYNTNAIPGTPGQNIAIRNCFINGNRGNGTTGDSNSGNARQAANGNWLFGIYLDNMAHVQIEHNWFYDEPSFNLLLNSCTDCIADSNRFDAVSAAVNQDGVHVDGPSSGIRISNNWFNSSDDATALNAPEGYSGPITGVAITNNVCVACLSFFLEYGGSYSGPNSNVIVSHVVIDNFTGSVQTYAAAGSCFILGFPYTAQGATDVLADLEISNISCSTLDSASTFMFLADNVGTLSLNNVHWIAPTGAIPMLDFFIFDQSSVTVSNLLVNGATIYRSAAGSAAAWLMTVPSTATVKRMEVGGFAVANEQGQSYSALSYLMDVQSGGAIGTFVLDGIDPALSPTLLNGNEWSRITNFYGPGVASYYRNTTYANLPPATYSGLAASIADSGTQVWGATAGTPLVLASAANASGGSTVYTGTITGGTSNALVGLKFLVVGFDLTANNGIFTCTASTITTLTLNNAAGVSDTHAATATYGGGASYAQLTSDGTNWTVTGK